MWIAILIILNLVLTMSAQAACTGSSPTWTTNVATLQSCINGASRGDTVNVVDSGIQTISSAISLTKGITVVGPGRDVLTIRRSAAGTFLSIVPDATARANSENITITGFTWDDQDRTSAMVQITGAGAGESKPYRYVVIGDHRFKNNKNEVIHTSCQVRGVIYNNIFDRTNPPFRPWGCDNVNVWLNSAYTGGAAQCLGCGDNLYFEDNTYICTSALSGVTDWGWIESGQDGRFVARYNTWHRQNCAGAGLPGGGTEWIDFHGFQNFSKTGADNGGQTGTMVAEAYGNTGTQMGGGRGFNYRGGFAMGFNNLAANTSAGHNITQYDASDNGGSGCSVNVAASSGGTLFQGEVRRHYHWNNTNNSGSSLSGGSIADVTKNNDPSVASGDNCGVDEDNVDGDAFDKGWWNLKTGSCTSAACTAGIGRGTSAPTGTCTKGTGFYVASTATPVTATDTVVVDGITTSPLNAASKTILQASSFYRCTATNTWTAYYQPYTYPHPLRSGAAPDVTPPAAPTGLRLL